jgi:hypothetical protein
MKNNEDFKYDKFLMGNNKWGSVWAVRKARRQLNRKWASRNPGRRRNHIDAYCEYVADFGYLTGNARYES